MAEEEEHSTKKLAKRLEVVRRQIAVCERSDIDAMILRVREGYYHDYMSPVVMPDVQLVCDLRELAKTTPQSARGMILNIVSEAIDGKFDATLKEGEEWMLSPEGQAALDSLPGRIQALRDEGLIDGHQEE
jgi:hypothetical protein